MELVSVQMGLNVLTESNMTLKVRCQFYLNLMMIFKLIQSVKFKMDQTRPHPLLLKLNQAIDVILVISNRTSIENKNIIIKPDITLKKTS